MTGDIVKGRGRLTPDDRKSIEEMAVRGLTPGQIALRLKRHQSTVAWFMYANGLKAPTQTDTPRTYIRNGRTVRRFSRAEDEALVELRLQGLNARQICEQINARFATERSHHTVLCRLKMLASIDDE